MSEKRTIPNIDQLAKLTNSLELAKETEQQAKKLCELAEKFALKYKNCLTEIEKN
ncbi:hypothetical protein [Chroococcus sp. FPU101]|uniref:hypothetical protein n=1 Tax=Chroococcus sp. FPU101 TaxID=1974212 RepID=UPI001A8CCB32|nr:hypothetical protein [Chroococcus sp. FPU101]GFE72011.1 hypothetical protein CFPU101_46210 [Chroococcus sp. FPU101]